MASSKFSVIYESVLITHFQAHHTPLLSSDMGGEAGGTNRKKQHKPGKHEMQ